MFRTVLVANRGEIAARVIRTCHAMGLRAVAVHTAADADMPYLAPGPYAPAADRAVEIGSYLSIDDVIAAARATGADAVHPGYGFLSENAAFARAVIDAGLVWVGPPPEAMEAMARKDHARDIAVAAGVPVVPRGEDATTPTEPGRPWGPVLVKAAAGGGGKGMRVVRSAAELDEAKAAAAREAASAFGDDTLLIERYVERGRHIEVQVFGDAHGDVIHLGTRDCSAQRRHQKVVEEAPAPTLTDAQRALVQDSAVALATKVGYTNAGTVEFLLDEATGEAYFLEMNTRLQVEHPVTEEVTGLDLVELQLRVAAGEPLGIAQDEVSFEGHAIEVRVYAEDPYAGFLPQAGTILDVGWPDSARVETAFFGGQQVSTSYDPMLAKIVAVGADREAARLGLLRELDDTYLHGVTTNLGFLRRLVASDEFGECAVHTAWLDSPAAEALLTRPDLPEHAGAAAADRWRQRYDGTGPFATADGWRVAGPAAPARVTFDIGGEERDFVAAPDARVHRVADRTGVWATYRGQTWRLAEPDRYRGAHETVSDGTIASPMPGTVLDVRVAEGEAVGEGQVLGVVEAMKMELALKAPYAGTVTRVAATVGAQVALGALLFEVTADE